MSITKRLLSVILTVCMIVAMVPATAISAAALPVSFAPVTVDEGETEVTVTFVVDGDFEEDDEYIITYDTSVFTYSGAECVDEEVVELSRGTKKQGYPVLVDFYEDNSFANETVGTVTLEIADGAAPGVYNFTDADSGEVVGTISIVSPSYEGFTLVFKADKTDVKPGDTFTITYKLYNIPEQGLMQYQFYNKFDSSFELSKVAVPNPLGGFDNHGGGALGGGLCGTIAPNRIYADSVIGTATFTVKANAVNGAHTIEEKIMPETGFGYTPTENLPAPTVVPAVINVTGGTDGPIEETYEAFTLEAKASVATAQPGDTFTVRYRLCTVPENGMGGWQFHVDYDATKLEITNVTIPETIEGHANYGTSNLAGLICGTFKLNNFYDDNAVGTVTFKVKDTASNGATTISFNTNTQGDCFYWVDGTGAMTNYANPVAVNANVEITGGAAQTFTVAFVDGETTLSSATYGAGETVTVPADPTKDADAQYTYTFAGWSDGTTTYAADAIPAASADVTYTAVYTTVTNEYTITWVVDGVETTETYAYGATPSFKGSVAKAADAQYTYRFAGFDPAIVPVTGDATYTAQYTTTAVTYTVTWVIAGQQTPETYEYGATVTFPNADRAPDAAYTYYLEGWTTGGVTYWIDSDSPTGFVVDSGEVDEEGDPIYVEATFPTVTGNVSITAEYLEDPNVFAYGNGMENWSNQTQLLIGLNLNNGETDGNLVDDYTYIVTIDGTDTYTWKASSCYNGGSWGIARIQPCLADPQWIPEKDVTYTVSVQVVNNGITVYTGSFDAFLDVDPIVPAAREAIGGKIQTGLYWYYDGAETLTIYGTEMPNELAFDKTARPWKDVEAYIKVVKFEGFMTKISKQVLDSMPALETVYVPEGVDTIYGDAFAHTPIKTLYLPSTIKTVSQGVTYDAQPTNVYFTGTAEMWTGVTVGSYNSGMRDDWGTKCLSFGTVTASGVEDGYTWTVYSNGTAIFQGEGATEMSGEKAWLDAGITDAYFFGFKSIQGGAFAHSDTIETVWIAQGTEAINGDAFAYSSLKEITIPASAAIRQGVVYGANSVTTVYYESFPSALTAAASAASYNGGIKDAANKFCMDDEPTWTTLSMGKYGSGFETNAGQTALMITLSDSNVNIKELYNNKADYEWVVTVDGKQYTWEPVSNYAFSDNNVIFRFNPMLADDFLVIEEGKEYKVESIELIQDGEVVYKGTSTDTWVGSTPIYPEGGYKLNLGKYGDGMENWSGETQILTTLSHDSISITNLFANKANYTWEVTIDGTPYRFAPSTNYAFSATNNIIRFEPCVYTTFVPVKDQAYTISVKLYDATGTNVLYYTDSVEGFKITVDPITHDEPVGPTVLTMGKYGTGMENWSGNTQILVTLDGKAGDGLDQVWANKTDYEWKITIDGTTYTWMPASAAWANDNALFVRFTPCLYETILVPKINKDYAVTKFEIVKDGEVLYTAASNDTWKLENAAPILPEAVKLNIGKWGDGMENWDGSPNGVQTQILPTLTSDVIDVENLFNNKGLFTWEITIDGTAYTYAPTTFYGGGINITRFEPCVNSDFVPVKDQEYTVSVKIYYGEALYCYTDTLGGFKITVDPIHDHNLAYTSNDDGTHTVYCSGCGTTIDTAEACTFGDWTTITPATKLADGLKQRVCSKCGYVEDEVIPKIAIVPATLDVDGLDVNFTALDDVLTIRVAYGTLDSADAVRSAVMAAFTSVRFVENAYTATFAPGDYTAAFYYSDGTTSIKTFTVVSIAIPASVSATGATATFTALNDVLTIRVAKGTVEAAAVKGAAIATFTSAAFVENALEATFAPGEYTVAFYYNDGTISTGTFTTVSVVTPASVSATGATATFTALDDVLTIRVAKGTVEAAAVRGATIAAFTSAAFAENVLEADFAPGEYTVAFYYNDGTISTGTFATVSVVTPACVSATGKTATFTALDDVLTIRVAKGIVEAAAVRGATIAAFTSAAFVENALEADFAPGEYTAAFYYNDGTISTASFTAESVVTKAIVSSEGTTLNVTALDDATVVRVAPGAFTTVADVKGSAIATYTAATIVDNAIARVVAPGEYTVAINYADGTSDVVAVEVVRVNSAKAEIANGVILFKNLSEVNVIRVAYADDYTTGAELKANAIATYTGFGEQFIRGFKDAEYQVGFYYADGSVDIQYLANGGGTLARGAGGITLDYLTAENGFTYVRYAVGQYSTAGEVKTAPGCKTILVSNSAIVDGSIVLDLEGSYDGYTFAFRFADGSDHIAHCPY